MSKYGILYPSDGISCFFFDINVNLKLNKIQYSVPSIAEKDMTSSGSGYERHIGISTAFHVVESQIFSINFISHM